MKNYKVTFWYDGYKYWDVIQATDPETAKEYFEHETNDGEAKVISITETTEHETYTAPKGYKYIPHVSHQRLSDEEYESIESLWDIFT